MPEATASQSQRSGFKWDVDIATLITIVGLTAVLFAGGLALSEGPGELGLDIDWKPFFVVYAVIVFVPWGTPTIAAALGATLAEGLLDIFEGAAADDPFGWAGYFVGFTVAGWFMKDTKNYVKLAIGAALGGFIQYAIEGLYLFALGAEGGSIFGAEFSSATMIYIVATVGNGITHGIILGAIVLLPTVSVLQSRADRLFPNARGGERRTAD